MARHVHALALGLALASLPVVAACGGPARTQKKKPQIARVFVHGDPRQMIAGVRLDPGGLVAADGLGALDGFALAGGAVFGQRTPQAESSDPPSQSGQEAIEEENAPSEDRTEELPVAYRFERRPGGFALRPEAGRDEIGLELVEDGGVVRLARAFGMSVSALHYSVKADGEAFSFLFEAEDQQIGKALVALYFAKIHPDAAALTDADTKYHYLLGPGVKTGWSGDVTVDLCGAVEPGEEQILRDATLAWAKEGKVGTQALTWRVTPDAPPFTDLNTHCLRVVDDYLQEDNDWSATLGLALPVLDSSRQTVVASDVFIFRKGLRKIYGEGFRTAMPRTVTHEVGHLLGLDHEFEKNAAGGYLHPSVMGYGDVAAPTEHDVGAIEAVYGTYPVGSWLH